jgi:divinyl protochlorophyllide a 8-vinyl-reductase
MVDEHDVTALQRAAFLHLGPERAARISTDAGRRTGDYLLANRIPRPAQAVLRKLPRRMAARLLLAAMARHAWTFAGSGRFSYETSPRLLLRVDDSPLCRSLRTDAPACHYFAATFERLFVAIISPSTRVVEIECRAAGGALCVFDVSWSTQ